jgi:uncharacterized protein
MSQPAKQEPTMEEILASIRRIIADDDLRPPTPPPAPDKPDPAGSESLPATLESAARGELVEGFDNPQISNVAANDVFEQRESPWRPGEDIAAPEETRALAALNVQLAAPKPVASLDPPRFSAPAEPVPPEQARELPSRDAPRPPRFEPFRSEVAKAEFAALEFARSEFARIDGAKSDLAKSDHAKSDLSRTELPKFELPRRDATRWEPPRPGLQESIRSEPARAEPMRPEPARPQAAALPPVLRAGGEDGLLSPHTTAAVDLAFNTLAQTVLVQNSLTLEDLVREMLKPMLKAWLDDNLPGLVERLVRAEIERVSRGRS